MLAGLARTIGNRLAGALNLPEEAAEKAAYALELIMLDVLTVGLILIAAGLSGIIWPALAATITAALMRTFSGGAHSESPWICIVFSGVLAVVLGLLGRGLALHMTATSTAVLAGAIVLPGSAVLLRYAPADTPAKPIPAAQAVVLRRISLALLISWVLFVWFVPMAEELRLASSAGMAWQLFTVTPVGRWFAHGMDAIFIFKGGEQRA